MAETALSEPWEQLRDAVHVGDVEGVEATLRAVPPGEFSRVLSRLKVEDLTLTMTMLEPEDAARIVEELPETQAAQLLDILEITLATELLERLASNRRAEILSRLPEQKAADVLAAMAPEEAEDARHLLEQQRDTAGDVMITEYLAYNERYLIMDLLADFRLNADKYRDFDVQYSYVVDDDERLVGVLRLREVVLALPDVPIREIMIREPLHVDVSTDLEELRRYFERHPLFGLPVVDAEGKLVGVVRRQDVERAAEDRSSRRFLEYTGILGGEEFRTLPLPTRSFRRLAWLSINVFLNVIAASVIAFYQDTIAAVIALAVFLPIISDMSGCSGSQAVAVTMRELTLGLIKPEDLFRVFFKEATLGIVNGFVLGFFLGMVAFLWKGNPWLGVVVGGALALSTLISVCIGGLIPLLLRRSGQDPALASAPVLTTLTDMCGFFIMLTFAQAALPLLTA